MRFTSIAAAIMLAGIFRASAAGLDGAKIDQLTGLKGKLNEKEGVYRVTFPRGDVKVTVEGGTMPPFMGLGTWAAFTKGGQTEAMVMGDTVLFEDEVNPVMSVALDGDFAVTEDELQPVLKSLRGANINIVAIHQHMTHEGPRMMFLHYRRAKATVLASAIKSALGLTKP